MIEKIQLAIVDESGNQVIVPENDSMIEIKLDYVIAHQYAAISDLHRAAADSEMKIAEKYAFALNLKKYLEESTNEHVF